MVTESTQAEKELLRQLMVEVYMDENSGMTSFHVVCSRGDWVGVKWMLEKGASSNVNVRDKSGRTPLHAACEKGHVKVFKLLVRNGADVEIKDNNGHSPLILACTYGHMKIVKLLLELGVAIQ